MERTELRDKIYDDLSESYQDGSEEGFVGLHGDDKVLVIQQDGQHFVVTISELFPTN